jgi:hypothetical protein
MNRFIVFLLGLTMMAGEIHAEEDKVTVRGLSQKLELTGWKMSWPVKGEIIPPLQPLPGGAMVAMVKLPDGHRDLVRWSKEGKELARVPLEIEGEIHASHRFGNRLVVASDAEVTEFDIATLRKGRARKLRVSRNGYTMFRVGPDGLWVVDEKSLYHFPLDGGPPRILALPLDRNRKGNLCPKDAPSPPCYLAENTGMYVSQQGDVFVLEMFQEQYPFKGAPGRYDRVFPSTATVLDAAGRIVAQKPFSTVKEKWQWFWTEGSGSGNPIGTPGDIGLIRTRHETKWMPASQPLDAHGNDFLFTSGNDEGTDESTVRSMNRKLETNWKVSFRNFAHFITSEDWARPLLIHDEGCYLFVSISENGRKQKDLVVYGIEGIQQEQFRTHYKRPRFAIGQSAEGDWLLIAY